MTPEPACKGATDLFYGPEVDLRDEPREEREKREEACREVCRTCDLQLACLQKALNQHEMFGVWGGFSPGERREIKVYLRRQGYKELPTGKELMANIEIYMGLPLRERRECKKQSATMYNKFMVPPKKRTA